MSKAWDVIIIGGGPGGALAAKKCAGNGLNTLLLEKKKMPRDKCCSGMVMGEWGQDIIREEFGEYPEEVLVETTNLHGYAMHVPGAPVQLLDINTPATWRKYLDAWMCKKAEQAGAEIWDSARVISVTEDDKQCIASIKKDDRQMELRSEFVIGADGSNSTSRKVLFPDCKPVFFSGYRICYETKLDLPEKRFNIFQKVGSNQVFFVHDKGNYMLLEGVAAKGMLKETIAQARQYLIDNHGLNPGIKPLWKDGCMQTLIYRELAKRTFRPARGNALVIGDAAGLNIPITGEGLASSLKSGQYAADAVIEAKRNSEKADRIYLESVDVMLSKFKDIYSFGGRIKAASDKNDPEEFSDAVLASWDFALKLF